MRPITHTRTNLPGTEPTGERPLRVVARDLRAAEQLAAHSHPWGQVTWALDGVMRVTVGSRAWIVPPQRAIWVPPTLVHEVATLEKARLRALYVQAELAPFADSECKVL